MTIAQLIDILRPFDPDAQVFAILQECALKLTQIMNYPVSLEELLSLIDSYARPSLSEIHSTDIFDPVVSAVEEREALRELYLKENYYDRQTV